MNARQVWTSRLVAVTAVTAWILANGLDVVSALFAVQFGGVFILIRYHAAESFLIYAGLRALGTLAIALLAIAVSRRWSSSSRVVWSALTACSLMTAIVAWWRLYQ